MQPFSYSIHLFRRDLRLHDNTALMAALSMSQRVIPVFIFDPRQRNNPYRGDNSFRFMLHSLAELHHELVQRGSRLYLFAGEAENVVETLFKTLPVQALFFNRDYTPFSRERDNQLMEHCAKHHVKSLVYADALLTEPEMVHKDDGLPYTVFTPFMRKAAQISISLPIACTASNFYHGDIEGEAGLPLLQKLMPSPLPNSRLHGGRKEGLHLLEKMEKLADYDAIRNLPDEKGTSMLSAHHKFGTVSIRETYHRVAELFGKEHTLVNELYWRDFFTHIAYHFPHVFGHAFKAKYDNLEWNHDETRFEKWCTGKTGFPIVDAGMRELVQTGYMHNRVRMITASFLVKDLHIDWRWGERFFANHLIDYDPAVNNGNWQWAASTGCDAQPYFRIFNPWSQQQKFDPQCTYIKKWIPELALVKPAEIHKLWMGNNIPGTYPETMVNHAEAAKISLALFKG